MFGFFQTHRLLLAPMAGVSDEAFRALCREQGADLAYTEMVSAKGLSFANEKTRACWRSRPARTRWPCSCSATSRTSWRGRPPGWKTSWGLRWRMWT